jgi:probable HAF family extracellular repeat protein
LDINDSGQVVGSTNAHAFLYNISTKTIKDLGTLGGDSSGGDGSEA